MPFTKKAEECIKAAEAAAASLNHNYIGTEHLLLGILRTDCLAAHVLLEQEVSEKRMIELIERLVAPESSVALQDRPGWTLRARDVLEFSVQEAQRASLAKAGSEHILMALIRNGDSVALRLLNTMGVNPGRVLADVYQAMGPEGAIYREEMEDAKNGTPAGTPNLDRFSRDLTALAAAGRLDPVIGRDRELQRLIQILSRRNKNNPCLIGEPGVGKTAIVELLAIRIASGQVPESVQDKRVLALPR